MLRELKGFALLEGARGRPPWTSKRWRKRIVDLSSFAVAHAHEIVSCDINPFLVLSKGAVALDAVIVRKSLIRRGERVSNQTSERFKAMRGKTPGRSRLLLVRRARSRSPSGAWFQSRFSGVTGFETDEGIVLVDSGMAPLGRRLAAMLREKTSAPIHTAIFTHGHVDHAYGLEAFLAPGPAASAHHRASQHARALCPL